MNNTIKEEARQLYPISFGQHQGDVVPRNITLSGWQAFRNFILEHRHRRKGGLYISNAFDNSRRKKVNAQERNWLPADLDGKISDDLFREVLAQIQHLEYIGHETHSSEPNFRKAHFFFPLTRFGGEDTVKAIGYHLHTKVAPNPLYAWDKKVQNPGHMMFLASPKVQVFANHGKVIDVDDWLAQTPVALDDVKKHVQFARPQILTDQSFVPYDFFKNNGLILSDAGDHFEVVCPWCDLHTDGRVAAGYYPPSALNNNAGGFVCLHSHCEDKSIRDIYDLIGKR